MVEHEHNLYCPQCTVRVSGCVGGATSACHSRNHVRCVLLLRWWQSAHLSLCLLLFYEQHPREHSVRTHGEPMSPLLYKPHCVAESWSSAEGQRRLIHCAATTNMAMAVLGVCSSY